MSNKKSRGRPRIMKNTKRIIVQLEQDDYESLQSVLYCTRDGSNISVSEFFRESVKTFLIESGNLP
jgi:hypothetical protein